MSVSLGELMVVGLAVLFLWRTQELYTVLRALGRFYAYLKDLMDGLKHRFEAAMHEAEAAAYQEKQLTEIKRLEVKKD